MLEKQYHLLGPSDCSTSNLCGLCNLWRGAAGCIRHLNGLQNITYAMQLSLLGAIRLEIVNEKECQLASTRQLHVILPV